VIEKGRTATKEDFDIEKKKLGRGDAGDRIPALVPGQVHLFEMDEAKANAVKCCRFKVTRDEPSQKESSDAESSCKVALRDFRKLGLLDNLKRPSRGIAIEEESSSDSGKTAREALAEAQYKQTITSLWGTYVKTTSHSYAQK